MNIKYLAMREFSTVAAQASKDGVCCTVQLWDVVILTVQLSNDKFIKEK